MPDRRPWTVDAYRTAERTAPAWTFMRTLEGRDKAEAIALVKLLEEFGSSLKRPHSGALGRGLFELRGRQVRLFYTFLPGRSAMLLDGEIKKSNAIPKATLQRVRHLQALAASQGARKERR